MAWPSQQFNYDFSLSFSNDANLVLDQGVEVESNPTKSQTSIKKKIKLTSKVWKYLDLIENKDPTKNTMEKA